MGWSSGTSIAISVIDAVHENVKEPQIREKIYIPIIEDMLYHDWDSYADCWGIDEAFDNALKKLDLDCSYLDEEDDDE